METFMDTWRERRERLRRRDMEMLFSRVPGKAFRSGLEMGAGDGFQSRILIRYCSRLVCTEYNKERLKILKQKRVPGLDYKIADAEKLPFKDSSFDLIFTSHMLEHIKDRGKCLREMKRVLREDGVMVHVIPNRLSKALNFLFYYPFIAYMAIDKERRAIAFKKFKENTTRDNIKSRDRSRLRKLLPPIHGEYPSHIAEFVRFGKDRWIELFENQGLHVQKVRKLTLSSTYRFGLDGLRRFGEAIGLSNSYAYIATKSGQGRKKAELLL